MVLTCCICIIHVAHLAIQRSQVSHPKSTQTVTASNAAPRCYQLWLIWLWVFNLLNQLGWIFLGLKGHMGVNLNLGMAYWTILAERDFFFLYDLSFGTLRFNNLRVHLFALFIIIDYNNDTQIWSTAVRHQTLSFSKQGFRPLIYFLYVFIACKSANLSKPFVSLTTLKNSTTYIGCFCFSWRFERGQNQIDPIWSTTSSLAYGCIWQIHALPSQ